MKPSVVIFEDSGYSNLFPIALTRPVFDLRCGILTLKEKITHDFPHYPVALLCRDYLADYVQSQNPDIPVNVMPESDCIFINGRIIADGSLPELLNVQEEKILLRDGQVVAARLKGDHIDQFSKSIIENSELDFLKDVSRTEIESAKLAGYFWDLVHHNPSEIQQDFKYFNWGGIIEGTVSSHAVLR
ncbi:MAG: putative sugar nucleotidyl transferase [Calditrichia bacterium]